MTMPAPVVRSTPAVSMSIAEPVSLVLICAGVRVGKADFNRPAIAAACGAAAEVPKKVVGKPPTPVTDTPSAAVMSGFWRKVPPVDEKLPGVIAVPFSRKKILRGPSELKVSETLAAVKGPGNGPEAGVAAQL